MTLNAQPPKGSNKPHRENAMSNVDTTATADITADPAITAISDESTRQLATVAPPNLKHVEHRNGLPIMDAVDYWRMYNTDIREFGAHGSATFNFQGYVRENREGYEHGEPFKDAIATNGILKGGNHGGIHVGTDGIVDYSDLTGNSRMRGPHDVGEYDIYIRIPTALQREKDVCVRFDSCIRASEVADRGDDPEEVYKSQEDYAEDSKKYGINEEASSYIVIRLSLDPKSDRQARRKAMVIHMAIVQHIEKERPLYEIENMARELEYDLMDMPPEEFDRKYPEL